MTKKLTLEEAVTLARNVPAEEWKDGNPNLYEFVYDNFENPNGPKIVIEEKYNIGQFPNKTYLINVHLDGRADRYSHFSETESLPTLWNEIYERREQHKVNSSKSALVKLGLSAERVEEIWGEQ